MKITDRFKRKETAYRDVEAGVVFKYENEYYMTTEEITDNYDDVCNCVNLGSGELLSFDIDTMVEVLDAELVIK
ncbi:hypothetical protein IJD44_00800 [bacterium]|nr:hypothetical protein [bacterium]